MSFPSSSSFVECWQSQPLVTSVFFSSSQPLDLDLLNLLFLLSHLSFSSSPSSLPLSPPTTTTTKKHSESAQRSRARKSLFVKSLEVENRELRRELFRLRAVVEAAVAGGHSLHPSALVPPPSFAAAAGGVAAAGAAYFAGEREREDEEEDEGGDDEEGQEESCRDECGASNAAFSSRSNGNLSAGSPISTDC